MEKQLPKNWVSVSLQDVAKNVKGKKPQIQSENEFEGSIPYMDIKALEYNIIRQFADIESSKLFEEGDVAMVWDGARSGWVSKTNFGAIGSTIVAFKPIKLNSNYLFYYLFEKYPFINSNTRGVGIPHVDPTILWDLKFPLAPLPEQNRIVDKLDRLFAQLETIKTSMANIPLLLKDFRQQVLTQAVTGKLTEEWRKGKELESGEDFIKKVINLRKANSSKKIDNLVFKKAEHTFEVDKSWTFGYLQFFGEFTRGKSKHRPRNDEKLFGGEYPFIQTGEVSRSNGYISNYKNTYSEFGLSQSRLFPKGTLCITIAANIAETGILGFDSCFPDSVVGYLPYENLYNAEFAMYYLNTIQKDLEHYAPATAQKNINLGILFDVPFPVPPYNEQIEIISRVKSLFAKADAIEKQYESLKAKIDTLPQALLNKAFKGELTEQLDSDGDARELLKEIQALKGATGKTVKSKTIKSATQKVKSYVEKDAVLGMVAEPKNC